MGIDVHEYRRYHGLDDPNPAARRVTAAQDKARVHKGTRSQRITEWRKARAIRGRQATPEGIQGRLT